jgi:hypothetical protein
MPRCWHCATTCCSCLRALERAARRRLAHQYSGIAGSRGGGFVRHQYSGIHTMGGKGAAWSGIRIQASIQWAAKGRLRQASVFTQEHMHAGAGACEHVPRTFSLNRRARADHTNSQRNAAPWMAAPPAPPSPAAKVPRYLGKCTRLFTHQLYSSINYTSKSAIFG